MMKPDMNLVQKALEVGIYDYYALILPGDEWYDRLKCDTVLCDAIHSSSTQRFDGILVKHDQEETLYINKGQFRKFLDCALDGIQIDGHFGELIYGFTEEQYQEYMKAGVDLGPICSCKIRVPTSYRSVTITEQSTIQAATWFEVGRFDVTIVEK